MESVQLTTADGHRISADVMVPGAACIGGVVVCHPHPQHGGDRFHPIVDAVFRQLPEFGFATLRFDFRAAFGSGVDERSDVVAALDELDRHQDGPLAIVGYSFGAAVALATVDERVTAVVAIAPPLTAIPVGSSIPAPSVPALVLVPQHDQFTPPVAAREATVDWTSVEVRVVASADHFLVGRAAFLAASAAEWLAERG